MHTCNLPLILMATLLFYASAAFSDPVDTAYDVIDALEYGDGYALEDLLTEDLYQTITGFLDQVREIASEDPALAQNLLDQRYHGRIQIADFSFLNNQELLGRLATEANVQPVSQVDRETAQMEGRNADVVLYYLDGSTVTFSMVWESSSWRVADSSLLYSLFQ